MLLIIYEFSRSFIIIGNWNVAIFSSFWRIFFRGATEKKLRIVCVSQMYFEVWVMMSYDALMP